MENLTVGSEEWIPPLSLQVILSYFCRQLAGFSHHTSPNPWGTLLPDVDRIFLGHFLKPSSAFSPSPPLFFSILTDMQKDYLPESPEPPHFLKPKLMKFSPKLTTYYNTKKIATNIRKQK